MLNLEIENTLKFQQDYQQEILKINENNCPLFIFDFNKFKQELLTPNSFISKDFFYQALFNYINYQKNEPENNFYSNPKLLSHVNEIIDCIIN